MRNPIEIAVSSELMAKLSELPDVRRAGPWTDEEDLALLEFWPIKPKAEVAKILGRGENQCRRRFIELAEGEA